MSKNEPPTSPPIRGEAYDDGTLTGEEWAEACATIVCALPGDEDHGRTLPRKPRCPYRGGAAGAWWEGFDEAVDNVLGDVAISRGAGT